MITNEVDGEILPIFPQAIYRAKLTTLTEEQLNYLNNLSYRNNNGNTTSRDTYILENILFKDIADEINSHISNYVNNVFNFKHQVNLKVTQSWSNITNTSQYHHEHYHPNSILSGVVYYSTIKDDCICFRKRNESTSLLTQGDKNEGNNNMFNSDIAEVDVNKNDLVIFPSSTIHYVRVNPTETARISLSFNTFIHNSTLGNKIELTELKL